MTSRHFFFRGTTFEVSCFEHYSNHPSWYSFLDEENIRDIFWNVKPGDYVLDVGAAFGSYGLTALASGAAFVWSWSPQHLPGEEPEKTTLDRSCSLNNWSEKSTVYDTAIYSRDGWLNLVNGEFTDTEPDKYIYSSFQRDKPWGPEEGSKFLTKKVESLDTWANREKPKKIDLMKIDVEGAEVEVLNGAQQLIKTFRPNILVENHLFRRDSIAQEVKDLILSFDSYREIGTIPYNEVSHSLYYSK